MNRQTLWMIGAVLLSVFSFSHSTHAQTAAEVEVSQESVESLLEAAFLISVTNDVAASKAAMDKVLSHPQATPSQRFQAHREMGRVYQARNQWKPSAEAYHQALGVKGITASERAYALLGLGEMLRRNNQREEALQSWREALSLPGITVAERFPLLLNTASLLQLQRQFKEAAEAAHDALALEGIGIQEQYDARVQLGRIILDSRDNATTAEAEVVLRQATDMEGIDANKRYEAVLLLGDALNRLQNPSGSFSSPVDNVYYDRWLDQGIEDYRKVLAMGELTVHQQIELHRRIADLQLNKMDVAAANQTLAEAVKIAEADLESQRQLHPQQTDYFRNLARYNQASAYARQLEPDLAREIYDEILRTGFPAANAQQKNQLILGRALLEESIEDQIALVLQYGKGALPALAAHYGQSRKHADLRRAVQVYRLIVEDTDAAPHTRFNAYRDWLNAAMAMDDYEVVKQVFTQYADHVQQMNTSFTRFTPFAGRRYWRPNHVRSWEFMANADFANWLSETFSADEVPDNQKLTFYSYIINGANQQHDYGKVKTYARRIVDEVPDLKQEERLGWLATIAVIDGQKKKEAVLSAVHQTLRSEQGVDAKAYAEALLKAGQYAMFMGDYPIAERLLEERNKRVVPEPKRSLQVRFLESGPRDITGFLQSEYFRDMRNHAVLDRQYGDNLQYLMDTDTGSTGRVMTTEDGGMISLDTGGSGGAGAGGSIATAAGRSGDHTFFVSSCDEEKIYFFFYIPMEREQVRRIREGAAGLGSFEITLAEGWNAPYTTLITGADGAIADDISITQYNNRNYRNKRVADGNTRVESRVLEDAVVMLLSFTWDAFVKLPQNGDKWYMEPIHWVKGGWTWGGSKSVHWLETQGELVFENLTVENRTVIQRRLLHRAKASFNQEVNARSNGYIEIWKDNQLGDQDFYAAKVADFHKRYADYAARIHADMTDEEVRTIFDEAYDALIHAKFIVAQKRYQYVLRKHLQE